ncbi:hypothetical protein [Streptomyces sp. NPDC006527]|uniref:hypothetical protein n=1 Tax=Streptomyces sp. NPDC006527 TaxID=3364749 RepID=UPI0036BB9BF1
MDFVRSRYVAVVLAIVLIRPASLLLSLIGTRFTRQEKLVAAWFGPSAVMTDRPDGTSG